MRTAKCKQKASPALFLCVQTRDYVDFVLIYIFLLSLRMYRLGKLKGYEQDSKVQFVIDAVYAFAHALDALKRDVCPGAKGVCPQMQHYDGGAFYKDYLLKVDFQGR